MSLNKTLLCHCLDIRIFLLTMVAMALFIGATSNRLDASETSWLLPGSGEWYDLANWTNGIPVAGDTAVFDTYPDANATIHLDSEAAVHELISSNIHTLVFNGSDLVFDDAASGGDAALILTSSSSQLTFDSRIRLDDDLYVNLFGHARATMNGGIGPGNADLTKSGTGLLALAGDSSPWSGDLMINEGTILVTHTNGLGDTVGQTTVHGSTLRLMVATSEQLVVDAGTVMMLGTAMHMNPINISSGMLFGVNNTHGGMINLSGAVIDLRGANFGLTGSLSGPGGLLKSTSGTVTLSGNNTYTGQTIVHGGTLVVNHANALGSFSTAESDATLVAAGGTLTCVFLPGNAPYAPEKIILDGGELQAQAGSSFDSVVLTGPIELVSDSVIRGGTRRRFYFQGPISGNGGVEFVPSPIPESGLINAFFIEGPTTYTGATIVRSGATVKFSQPLNSDGFMHVQGRLHLSLGGADRQIEVDGGELLLFRGSFDHNVTLNQGTLGGGEDDSVGGEMPATLTTDLLLDGWGQLGTESGDDYLILTGGVSGAGSLEIVNHVTLQGSLTHRGDLFVVSRGDVDASGLLSHIGDIVITSGQGASLNILGTIGPSVQDVLLTGADGACLNIGANNEVRTIVLDPRNVGHGSWVKKCILDIHPENILTVQNQIRFLGGTIRGHIDGDALLTKSSRLEGWLTDIGDSSFQEIVVEAGLVNITGTVGNAPSIVRLMDSPSARLKLWDVGTYAGDIYLNHSASERDGPALSAGGDTILSGNLYLDLAGSALEYSDITGSLQGGSLSIWNYTVTIRSGNHSYTGGTYIERGELVLTDDGVLNSTSHIVGQGRLSYEGKPELVLDNTGTTGHLDRIPDATPVTSTGMKLHLIGRGGETISETIGSLTTTTGLTTLVAENNTAPGSQTTLKFNSLQRESGAVIQFTTINPGAEIRYAVAPALDDNIIGGWAIVDATDFASYGPEGITAYSELHANVSDINAATASDNVLLSGGAILTVDRSINSLRLDSDWENDESLDLNGHTLNIESGGLLLRKTYYHPVVLTGGVLTAGGNADGELIITAPEGGGLSIESNIADNGSGSVGVTFSSDNSAVLILSGTNTYSGPTTINGSASLQAAADHALPEHTDLVLNGSSLMIDYTGTDPIELDKVVLRRAGYIGKDTMDAPPIDADTYLLESGEIGAVIVGDGTMIKTGIGTVLLWESNPDFTGQVIIEGGTLIATTMSLGDAPDDDDHAIIIRRDGVLDSESFAFESVTPFEGRKIILEGGTLEGTTRAESIEVRQPSTIAGRSTIVIGDLSGTGDLTLDCYFKGDYSSAGMIIAGSLNAYKGDLNVTGYRINISGDNNAYNGNIFVSAERLSATGSSRALGTGRITVLPSGMLEFDSNLTANVHLEGGGIRFYKASSCLDGELTITDKARVQLAWDYDYTVRGTIQSTLCLEDMAELKITPAFPRTVFGDIKFGGQLQIIGEILVGGDAAITAYDSPVTISNRIIADAPVAELDIVGGSNIDFRASLKAPENTVLAVTFNGLSVPIELAGGFVSASGTGTLRNDLVVTSGATIQPGDSVGLLTIDGNTTIGDGGRLIIELGGTVRGTEYDAIDVTAQALLGGILQINLLGNFVPELGDEFGILSADHVDGVFPVISGFEISDDLSLAALYSSDNVVLRATLPGDFSLNDVVDAADFIAWSEGFGTATNAIWTIGDSDADTDTDGADFLLWQRQYGVAAGDTAFHQIIPEPTSWSIAACLPCWLVVLSLLGIEHEQRCRMAWQWWAMDQTGKVDSENRLGCVSNGK